MPVEVSLESEWRAWNNDDHQADRGHLIVKLQAMAGSAGLYGGFDAFVPTTLSIPQQRQRLPIFEHRKQFLYLVEHYSAVVVIGESGCGKTTQLPQYLYETGWNFDGKQIISVQPRNSDAVAGAERVAFELDTIVGDKQFFHTSPEAPRLATLSIDTKRSPVDIQFLSSPCADYSAQTLQTIRSIHDTEPPGDILVFLPSRTDIDRVISFLTDESLANQQGTQELLPLALHLGLPQERWKAVFEPTNRSVRKVILTTDDLMKRVIHLDNLTYVIDCGFHQVSKWDTKLQSLVDRIQPIAQTQAIQRSRCVGRIKPGKVFRLYTESTFKELSDMLGPQFESCDPALFILALKALGIDNIYRFPMLSRPEPTWLASGLELLHALGALNDDGCLASPFGYQLAKWPLPPMLAKSVIEAQQDGCGRDMIIIAAMLHAGNLFLSPPRQHNNQDAYLPPYVVQEGDHLTMLNVYRTFIAKRESPLWCQKHALSYHTLIRAKSMVERFTHLAYDTGLCRQGDSLSSTRDPQSIRYCLTRGHFPHVARMLPDGSFQPLSRQTTQVNISKAPPSSTEPTLYLDAKSVLFKCAMSHVIYSETRTVGDKVYMKHVTVIDPKWLDDIAPGYYAKVD
ncbi:ATPdependent RNA helicase [Dispira parvispora]|uniref:ATPdependent RNA helicase n=1 Tax=Dispira parvispora TaxID=1520584 RepID=A0A9W8AU19_9FUNG|nr:ATPdependent RNA helicase [Dispira parvispora]